MPNKQFWLVGLDPREAFNQQILFDRWEVIHIESMDEAITRYMFMHHLPSSSRGEVKVWHKSVTPFSVLVWLSKHRIFLPILKRCILDVKPIGEGVSRVC